MLLKWRWERMRERDERQIKALMMSRMNVKKSKSEDRIILYWIPKLTS